MGIARTCAVCKKPFEARESDVRKGNGKYCTRKCFIDKIRRDTIGREKKPDHWWKTEDELAFIARISTKKPYLVGYKQAMLKRTDWKWLDKEAICRVLGI